MAQPLARTDSQADLLSEAPTFSGIDAAGERLEKAFARLEQAARRANAGQHSHKAEREKLNGLLQGAQAEIARLRSIAGTVSTRLDHTIATLERTQSPLHS